MHKAYGGLGVVDVTAALLKGRDQLTRELTEMRKQMWRQACSSAVKTAAYYPGLVAIIKRYHYFNIAKNRFC